MTEFYLDLLKYSKRKNSKQEKLTACPYHLIQNQEYRARYAQFVRLVNSIDMRSFGIARVWWCSGLPISQQASRRWFICSSPCDIKGRALARHSVCRCGWLVKDRHATEGFFSSLDIVNCTRSDCVFLVVGQGNVIACSGVIKLGQVPATDCQD